MTTTTLLGTGTTFSLTTNETGILATGSNDTLYSAQPGGTSSPTDSDDVISMGSGTGELIVPWLHDTIIGGTGSGTFNEWFGSDSYDLSTGAYTLFLKSNDTVAIGGGTDTIEGSSSTDNLYEFTNGTYTVYVGSHNTISITGASAVATITSESTDNLYELGDGNFSVNLLSGDTFSAGNGTDTINLLASDTTNFLSLGGGTDVVLGDYNHGNFSISGGSGAYDFEFADYGTSSLTPTNITIGRSNGVDAASTFDFYGSTLNSVDITINNAADIIELGGNAKITNFTINVAVDGFKLPDGNSVFNSSTSKLSPTAVVNYEHTNEVINSAYAQAQPLPYFIQELLFSPVPRWNNELGQGLTLEFSFMQSLPSYALNEQDDPTNFAALGGNVPAGLSPSALLAENASHVITLGSAELQAVEALASWELVANVTFISAVDGDTVPLRIGSTNQGTSSGGYSYLPFTDDHNTLSASGTVSVGTEEGLVFINNDTAVEPLSDYQRVFIHEFGHVLGLGGESGNGDIFDQLPGSTGQSNGGGEDSGIYTVMSYNNNSPTTNLSPGIFDIAVAQYLEGADPTLNATATTFTFSSAYGNTHNLIVGAGNSADVISAGSWSSAGLIDLRQGHWSWLGASQATGSTSINPGSNSPGYLGQPDIFDANQLFIDYGTVVDNIDAHLTSGAMTLVANDGDDSIWAGSGTDLIVVAAGDDTVRGGSGTDTVLFQAAESDYTTQYLGSGEYIVTADSSLYGGTDYLYGVSDLAFTDTTVALSNSALTTTEVEALDAAGVQALTSTQLNTLSADDVAVLSTTQVDALLSSQIKGLSTTILDELSTTNLGALTDTQIPSLSSTQIISLGSVGMNALSTTAIAALTTSQAEVLTYSEVANLSLANLDALTTTALGYFFSTAGAALSTTQVESLSSTQIGGLNSAALTAISTSALGLLSADQATGLTSTQIHILFTNVLNAINSTAIAALSTTQADGLTASQIAGLTTTNFAALNQNAAILASFTSAQLAGLTSTEIEFSLHRPDRAVEHHPVLRPGPGAGCRAAGHPDRPTAGRPSQRLHHHRNGRDFGRAARGHQSEPVRRPLDHQFQGADHHGPGGAAGQPDRRPQLDPAGRARHHRPQRAGDERFRRAAGDADSRPHHHPGRRSLHRRARCAFHHGGRNLEHHPGRRPDLDPGGRACHHGARRDHLDRAGRLQCGARGRPELHPGAEPVRDPDRRPDHHGARRADRFGPRRAVGGADRRPVAGPDRRPFDHRHRRVLDHRDRRALDHPGRNRSARPSLPAPPPRRSTRLPPRPSAPCSARNCAACHRPRWPAFRPPPSTRSPPPRSGPWRPARPRP